MDYFEKLTHKQAKQLYYNKYRYKLTIPFVYGYHCRAGIGCETRSRLLDRCFHSKIEHTTRTESKVAIFFNDIELLDHIFDDEDVIKHISISVLYNSNDIVSVGQIISTKKYDYKVYFKSNCDCKVYNWASEQPDVLLCWGSRYCYINKWKLTMMQLAHGEQILKILSIVNI